jgi:hypothetical protein
MKNLLVVGAYASLLLLTACGGGNTESPYAKLTANAQISSLPAASAASASINYGVRQGSVSQEMQIPTYWVSLNNELSEPLKQALSKLKVNFVHHNEDRSSALFFNIESMPNNWLDIAKSSLAQGKVLMIESPRDIENDQKTAQVINSIANIEAQARYVVVLPCKCQEGTHTIVQFQDDQLPEALNLIGSTAL